VWGNTAVQGGGIYNYQGAFSLTNCTVSGNTAVEAGGGIDNRGESAVMSSTIADNQAPLASAIVFASGHMSIANSIIDGGCYQEGHPNEVSSDGGNIESPGDTCGLTDPTDITEVAVEQLDLEPLAQSSGPTPTHLPGPDSVAINVIPEAACVDVEGARLTTDQRGVWRPVGPMSDVGAVEVVPQP
jgi:hypothetical protein